MRSVNIDELQDRLSTYITYAKAGETIVIRDRNTPVAQLVPIPGDDGLTEEQRSLVADGILRMGKLPWDIAALDHFPIPQVEVGAGLQAVLDEREEGW
jgi:antitoxin (DNA-binding transcriptional repressor) of toxin-antitoxin stability system